MLPLKDDIPTDRLPLVTLLAIAAQLLVCLLMRDAGILPLLASALLLWTFGTSVEDAMSRPRFLAFCLLGGGAALALRAIDPSGAPATAIAAAGVTSAAVGAHLRLYPGAHVVALVPVPFAFTLAQPPTWAIAGAWVVLLGIFAVTSIGGPLADGGAVTLLAAAGGFIVGLLTIGRFAQRRKHHPAPLASPLPS